MKSKLINLISLLLSVVCLLIIFAGVDLAAVQSALSDVNPLRFIWSLLIVIALLFIQGWRTQVLLNNQASLVSSTTSLMLGNFASMVLPLRLGEVLRIGLLKQKDDIPWATSLSMVILSQILDVIGILGLAGILFLLSPPPAEVFPVIIVLAVATVFILAVMFVLARTKKLGLITNQRIQQFIEDSISGLRILRHPRQFLLTIVLTLLFWFGIAYANWVFLPDLISAPIFSMAIAVTFASGVGRALPALPGSIGTLDLSIAIALQSYGVENNIALVLVLLIRIRYIFMVSITGLGALFYENLSLQQVTSLAKNTRSDLATKDHAMPESTDRATALMPDSTLQSNLTDNP